MRARGALPWCVAVRGNSYLCVCTRAVTPSAYLRSNLTRRRVGGAFGLHFQRGLMLDPRLKERNTMVLSEIDSEHFYDDQKLDMGSNTNFCAQNRINHTQNNKDLRDLANDAYVHKK